MFSMWEKVSGAIMFVRVNGRVIPSPAQAESTNFKANSEWGTKEDGNEPGYPRWNGHSAARLSVTNTLRTFEHQGRKDHDDEKPAYKQTLKAGITSRAADLFRLLLPSRFVFKNPTTSPSHENTLPRYLCPVVLSNAVHEDICSSDDPR